MSLHKPEEIEHPDFNWTKGEVDDIAYLGGHSVYHIQLPSGKIVQAFIANAERHGKRP
jgi:putrescine transport system ATP-binding protein